MRYLKQLDYWSRERTRNPEGAVKQDIKGVVQSFTQRNAYLGISSSRLIFFSPFGLLSPPLCRLGFLRSPLPVVAPLVNVAIIPVDAVVRLVLKPHIVSRSLLLELNLPQHRNLVEFSPRYEGPDDPLRLPGRLRHPDHLRRRHDDVAGEVVIAEQFLWKLVKDLKKVS